MTADAPKAGKPPSRARKASWIALLGLVLAVYVAIQTGWAGFGWAHLWAGVFPKDEELLGFVPADAAAVAILDPHRIDVKALGGEEAALRKALERARADFDKATGIDLAFDVDKIVVSQYGVVARGRFDDAALTKSLSDHRYAQAEHAGVRYLVRAGEDAIAVVGGDVLLYGDEAGVKAAIDADKSGKSLENEQGVRERLAQMGWDKAVLATLRGSDDRPSLRSILTGSTGPRAVTIGLSMKTGLDLHGAVEAASSGAAEELAKLLDEKRRSLDAVKGAVGQDVGPILADIAKEARISAVAGTSTVSIQVHVEPAALDALVAGARKAFQGAPAEAWKALRIFQLLVPAR